ncbi:MAG: hypothetical protein U1E69_05010 [Tabrizicola sp.]|uniref:hypothetical protein n=1 Tax=Tabrizicola sp. TaxID=2005166 RepID=UPI002ABB74DD|nr:hypothetical protein [Tabrizicola sp.]MDZ4086146.1 hypothetical protein [Tabrizicola sp.]
MIPPQIAVLTGDLVASTRHSADQVDAAMQALRHAAGQIAAWHSPPGNTRFTRFRGDGWQLALTAPGLALRAAVVLQATLGAMGLESRISIGIGPAESLGTTDLADAAGKAFELSGQGLDKMADASRIAIAGPSVTDADAMIADLLGERMGRWTAAQAEAAALQLASPDRTLTLAEVGKALGISPQAVNDRVRGAGCGTIASVLRRWEALKRRDSRDPAP